jgi:hypothetical protein
MFPNFNNNKNKHYSLLLTSSFVIFNLGKKVKEVFGNLSNKRSIAHIRRIQKLQQKTKNP